MLSVPFSSGWALRFEPEPSTFALQVFFQFPFHRDGPCDTAVEVHAPAAEEALSVPFSSGWALRYLSPDQIIQVGIRLSVPFSSGWALRSPRTRLRPWRISSPFSSLFIGMGLAISPDRMRPRLGETLSVPFSSGWALRFKLVRDRGSWYCGCFQFPFHRDGPCDCY